MRKKPKSNLSAGGTANAAANFELPGKPISSLVDPVIIGRVARPVGTRGQVKVVIESGDLKRLQSEKKIILMTNIGFRSFEIIHQQIVGKAIRLELSGVESIETASLLSGVDIVIESGDRQDLVEDEYYDDGIIGCRVTVDDETELGIVLEIMHQEHHDLWIIDGPYGEIMIPAVGQFIKEVDLDSHRIIVNRVEGLWVED